MLCLRWSTRVVLGTYTLIALSACGRSRAETSSYKDALPPPEDPMVMEGDIGRYGGRFVVVVGGAPVTFNPVVATGVPTLELGAQLFVRLTRLDGTTQQDVPFLAKSWDTSPDGLTWTFHLHRGAKFSDGRALTANDVVFSFAAIYDPRIPSTVKDRVSTKGVPWAVSAADPYTVTITTPEPVAVVPSLAGNVRILPKHMLERSWRDGTLATAYALTTPPDQLVTSGPWQLKSFTPGDKTVLVRNPHWFGVDGTGHRLPYLDELVLVTVPDQNAAHLKFEAGEVDALPDAIPENFGWYQEHQRDGRFTVYDGGPTLGATFFWFNLNRVRTGTPGKPAGTPQVDPIKFGWFSNAVFRRAVSMAIDRDAIIKSVFYGNAVKNWSSATAGNKNWYMPDIVHDDYDPAQARRLLAGLGWSDRDADGTLKDTGGHPVAFTLTTNSYNTLRVAMANFVRDDLAKIGIRVTLSIIDFNALTANIRSGSHYDAAMLGILFGQDPSDHAILWHSSSGLHQWSNLQPKPDTAEEARIDALLDGLAGTADSSKRRTMWRELQTIANEQSWLVWLPVPISKIPVRSRFGNMHPTAAIVGLTGVGWNAEQIYVKAER